MCQVGRWHIANIGCHLQGLIEHSQVRNQGTKSYATCISDSERANSKSCFPNLMSDYASKLIKLLVFNYYIGPFLSIYTRTLEGTLTLSWSTNKWLAQVASRLSPKAQPRPRLDIGSGIQTLETPERDLIIYYSHSE